MAQKEAALAANDDICILVNMLIISIHHHTDHFPDISIPCGVITTHPKIRLTTRCSGV